jgi:hypothetical protein
MATSESIPTTEQSTGCANCSSDLHGGFCHLCGEKKIHDHDLTVKHFFLHAVHEFTHLDSKVFATVRYLFTRPGFLTQEYIAGRRSRYMKPLALFLIGSALYLLVGSFVMLSPFDVHQLSKADKRGQLDAAWTKLAEKKKVPKEVIIDRVQETMHKITTAALLADVLAMALLLAVLFRGRYFVEHLVFSLHFMSFTYLASILLSPVYAFRNPGTWQAIVMTVIVSTAYLTYLVIALRRVYGESLRVSVLKGIVSYAVTQAAMIFTVIVAFVLAIIRAAKS